MSAIASVSENALIHAAPPSFTQFGNFMHPVQFLSPQLYNKIGTQGPTPVQGTYKEPYSGLQ